MYNSINHHLYNYSFNNPVKYKDPDGRQPLTPWEQLYLQTVVNIAFTDEPTLTVAEMDGIIVRWEGQEADINHDNRHSHGWHDLRAGFFADQEVRDFVHNAAVVAFAAFAVHHSGQSADNASSGSHQGSSAGTVPIQITAPTFLGDAGSDFRENANDMIKEWPDWDSPPTGKFTPVQSRRQGPIPNYNWNRNGDTVSEDQMGRDSVDGWNTYLNGRGVWNNSGGWD
jgi:hypothetical protein